jgi:hypothetical protein
MKSGKLLVVEVKAPGGKLTEAQALFLDRVRSAGGHAGVARSLDDALAIVEGRTVTARAPKLSLPRRRHDPGPALRAEKRQFIKRHPDATATQYQAFIGDL